MPSHIVSKYHWRSKFVMRLLKCGKSGERICFSISKESKERHSTSTRQLHLQKVPRVTTLYLRYLLGGTFGDDLAATYEKIKIKWLPFTK